MSQSDISNEEMLSRIVRFESLEERGIPLMFIDSILPGHQRMKEAGLVLRWPTRLSVCTAAVLKSNQRRESGVLSLSCYATRGESTPLTPRAGFTPTVG